MRKAGLSRLPGESLLVGETAPSPRSGQAVAEGDKQGRRHGGPSLDGEATLKHRGASLPPSQPLRAALNYHRSHYSHARPAPPGPASSSLQCLPPTAGRTLDSPSEIPPSGPAPTTHPTATPKEPWEEEKGPMRGLCRQGPQPRSRLPCTGSRRDPVVWNLLEKHVSGTDLGKKPGSAPYYLGILEMTSSF